MTMQQQQLNRFIQFTHVHVPLERNVFTWLAPCFGIGLAASLLLITLVLLLATPVRAGSTPENIQHGSLFMTAAGSSERRETPLLHTAVQFKITGLIARAQVTQTFRNDSELWVEGVYVFPLPENAAVDHLRMQVGTRTIEGQIQERSAAKRSYEQAKQAGKKAALVEQDRPNMFTNSVANIGPHDTVIVEIEYQQTLRYDQGSFYLRFPTTITPRYIPGEERAEGSDEKAPDAVPDAARITPPTLPASIKINPISLHIELDAGFPLQHVASPSHTIVVQTQDKRVNIALADSATVSDRDFELVWTPHVGSAPQAAVFTEQRADGMYHLLMILPPLAGTASVTLPRETIFIIDTSGSMAGTSMEQAKQALAMALERLRPTDRFDVIEFNSHTRVLFGGARYASVDDLQRAQRFVAALHAGGGTEMAPALRAALDGRAHHDVLRQVIFLTDASVGNEDALFELIQNRLGDSRLFTVGIGSAPNSHFMKKAAEFGHGTFTAIGDVKEVQARMSALFEKLEQPALTGIDITWPTDTTLEFWPRKLPDLYAGEPLIISARTAAASGEVSIRGMRGQQPWHATLPLHGGTAASGVDVLWARAKIEALLDQALAGLDATRLRQQVIDVALRHHLVSKYTSLIAVDVTPIRPDTDPLHTQTMPVNLPAGMVYSKVFGALPQTATPGPLFLLLGCLLLLLGRMLRPRAKTA